MRKEGMYIPSIVDGLTVNEILIRMAALNEQGFGELRPKVEGAGVRGIYVQGDKGNEVLVIGLCLDQKK